MDEIFEARDIAAAREIIHNTLPGLEVTGLEVRVRSEEGNISIVSMDKARYLCQAAAEKAEREGNVELAAAAYEEWLNYVHENYEDSIERLSTKALIYNKLLSLFLGRSMPDRAEAVIADMGSYNDAIQALSADNFGVLSDESGFNDSIHALLVLLKGDRITRKTANADTLSA